MRRQASSAYSQWQPGDSANAANRRGFGLQGGDQKRSSIIGVNMLRSGQHHSIFPGVCGIHTIHDTIDAGILRHCARDRADVRATEPNLDQRCPSSLPAHRKVLRDVIAVVRAHISDPRWVLVHFAQPPIRLFCKEADVVLAYGAKLLHF